MRLILNLLLFLLLLTQPVVVFASHPDLADPSGVAKFTDYESWKAGNLQKAESVRPKIESFEDVLNMLSVPNQEGNQIYYGGATFTLEDGEINVDVVDYDTYSGQLYEEGRKTESIMWYLADYFVPDTPETTSEVAVAAAATIPAGKLLKLVKDLGVDKVKKIFQRKAPKGAEQKIHKNSNDYVGDTHVYSIKNKTGGATHKVGESAQGVRKTDGKSIRAEQQARKLREDTGQSYESKIRKTFPDKKSAREYETKLIERFRSIYGKDKLPGNKTNR